MNLRKPYPDVTRARLFAEMAHGGQPYADEVPHTYHLKLVVDVLERFDFREPEMICAGWMHDLIEDTNRSYNDIKERFGEDVAELVFLVTNELGRNRAERNAKTYPKIRGHNAATALKLADRIANVEYGLANGGTMLDKYRKEYSAFRGALHVDVGDRRVERMWAFLDQLMSGVTA